MRNLIGGLLGALIIASLITLFLQSVIVPYPLPFDSIWFILDGAEKLSETVSNLTNGPYLISVIFALLIAGPILGVFSRSFWNIFRTVLWTGVILAILSTSSLLLKDSQFWYSADRNVILLSIFIQSLLLSVTSIITTAPVIKLIETMRERGEPITITKIETRCECGAVFKSNPILCSECGRVLDNQT